MFMLLLSFEWPFIELAFWYYPIFWNMFQISWLGRIAAIMIAGQIFQTSEGGREKCFTGKHPGISERYWAKHYSGKTKMLLLEYLGTHCVEKQLRDNLKPITNTCLVWWEEGSRWGPDVSYWDRGCSPRLRVMNRQQRHSWGEPRNCLI